MKKKQYRLVEKLVREAAASCGLKSVKYRESGGIDDIIELRSETESNRVPCERFHITVRKNTTITDVVSDLDMLCRSFDPDLSAGDRFCSGEIPSAELFTFAISSYEKLKSQLIELRLILSGMISADPLNCIPQDCKTTI